MNEQTCAQESREFLTHLGLTSDNLRQMLSVENGLISIADKNYTWNDLYGKTPVLNVLQYLREYVTVIQTELEEKKRNILCQVEEYLVPEIKRQPDKETIKMLLDHDSKESLVYVLECEMKQQDCMHLEEIHEQTYGLLQEEEMAASTARPFFGHREEKVANLMESMDNYIRQRYEIIRYQAMSAIYKDVIRDLRLISYRDLVKE